VHVKTERKCPRCHEGVMRAWYELDDEEQELVKRLPASADFTAEERQRSHQWCALCWYEAIEKNVRSA
jgi:hypothetical protein